MLNIRKRYASDCSSSNLIDDERHHDTESLAAVALGADDFGAMLLRAKHAQHVSGELIMAWRGIVFEKSIKHKWQEVAEEVADISLWAYLDDSTCPTCNGRGAAVIVGSPHLSDVFCEPCAGTGRTPREFDTAIRAQVHMCIEALKRKEGRASGESARKIG